MIYESRRQSVPRRRRRTAAQAEGEAFYGALSRPYKHRKRQQYENRFRTHLAIELWNYARRRELLDPTFPPGPATKLSFSKFADEQEILIDGIFGIAESIPIPPYDPKKVDLTLLVAANIGARKSPRIQNFSIADVIELIGAAYAKSRDDRGAIDIWSK